jgi:CopG family transcriptional regulator, nickel-responsive regulator
VPVVSVSLPKDLVAELDTAVAAQGYRGRSEFLRAAVRLQLQQEPPQAGHIHGSITLFYPPGGEARVSEVRHAYHDVVLSMMHTHCERELCMDVLLVGGPSERVRELLDVLHRDRQIRRARLVQL